jgi:hypothetical protein
MVTRTKTESEVVMRATAARNIQVTGPQNNAMTYEGLADKMQTTWQTARFQY